VTVLCDDEELGKTDVAHGEDAGWKDGYENFLLSLQGAKAKLSSRRLALEVWDKSMVGGGDDFLGRVDLHGGDTMKLLDPAWMDRYQEKKAKSIKKKNMSSPKMDPSGDDDEDYGEGEGKDAPATVTTSVVARVTEIAFPLQPNPNYTEQENGLVQVSTTCRPAMATTQSLSFSHTLTHAHMHTHIHTHTQTPREPWCCGDRKSL
jgi:hypothetical protein